MSAREELLAALLVERFLTPTPPPKPLPHCPTEHVLALLHELYDEEDEGVA